MHVIPDFPRCVLTEVTLALVGMQGTAESPARVVLVSSVVHHCCGRMLRQDMNFEQSYFSLRAYGHSKLAQVPPFCHLSLIPKQALSLRVALGDLCNARHLQLCKWFVLIILGPKFWRVAYADDAVIALFPGGGGGGVKGGGAKF